MRKFFGFRRQKDKLFLDSSAIQQRNGADTVPDCSSRISSGPKYHIRDKDLGKIHKAASTGNVQKVQKLLLRKKKYLNDRDKKNRTALHLACANGHTEVVTLLTDSKCELNYCDDDNRTALIKAIQCQQEECAAILIKCGANPNVMDIDGNTALHFAVAGQNMELAEELLLNKADIEAKNKDELTPLLLAINEHRHQMAKFLIKKNANIHAVDRFKRTSLMLAVNDSSTDLVKLLLQEGVNVLAEDKNGSTAEEHAFKTGLTFNYRLIRDYKVEEICKQLSQNSNQDISQTDTDLQDSTEELSRNKNSIADSLNLYPRLKRMVEVTDFVSNKEVGMEATRTSRSGHEISEEDSVSSNPQLGDSWSSADSEELSFHTKEEAIASAIGNKENVKMSALGIGEEKEAKSSWHSEDFSTSLPKIYAEGLPGAADQKGKNLQTEQIAGHEISEEDSVSSNPQLGDSWSSADSEELSFHTKNVVNPSVAKIMTVIQQSLKNIEEKYGTLSIVEEDNKADRENKVMVETLPKSSAAIQNWSHPDFPSTEPLLKPSVVSLAVIGITKEEAIKPGIGNKENGMDISERAPREQTNKDNVNNVDGTQEKNTSVKMSALGIGEDEEAESPWDSEEEAIKPAIGSKESVKKSALGIEEEEVESPWDSEDSSTSLPINYVDDLPGAADQQGKTIQNEQVADSLENFPHLKPTIEVKDSVPNKAVEMKGTQSSRSDSSHLDSASLPLNHETRRGSGDLKVHNKLPFLSQLMTAKHSAFTDIGHMTLMDKCKTNIRAVFLRGDQRLHDLRESQRPENRESKEDLSAELVLGRTTEKEHKILDGSKTNHSQEKAIKPKIGNKENVKMSALGTGEEKEAKSSRDSEDFSTSLPKIYAEGLPGAADQKGKNLQTEQIAGHEISEEDSVSSNPQLGDSWSSADSEELSFHTKNVVNPSVAKIMTVIQQSLKNIEEKYGTLSIVEEDNEADRENKVMVETLPKSSAAIQNWSHPDFPSTEPLLKPSVVSLAVIGITKEEAIKPGIGNKENGMDISERAPREQTNKDNVNNVDGTQEKNTSVKMSALGIGEDEEAESPWDSEDSSTSLPINYVDDLPGAADQRGKNIQNEQVAGSLEKFPHLKPTIEVKGSVPKKAVEMKGTQSSRSDKLYSSHLDSASLPLNHETHQGSGDLKVNNELPFVPQSLTPKESVSTDIGHMTLTDKCKTNIRAVFLRGDQRLHDLCESQLPENGESKEDLSAELVLGRTIEKEHKRLDGSKTNHSQEEAIKPAIGSKENVKKSALGIEEEEVESPWDSEDSSTSLPINYVDDLPGAADQRGKNIQNEQVAGSLEKFPHLKPTIEVKGSVPKKAVEMKGTQSSRSDSSHLDSASLPLNRETRQGSGDLKVDNELPFVSQSMTTKQSASPDIGLMTLTDKCKTSIRAVFLQGYQSLHDVCESQLPENRESEEDLSAELVLGRTTEKEHKRLDGSKTNHSQNFSASVPKKYVDHLSGAADQRGKNILSGQVEGSLEKYALLKPTIKGKDPVSKEAVGMKNIPTSRSDSFENSPHSKPTIKVKDPVPRKAVEMKATQTSRSDSSDLDSARSSLKHRTCEKSRDLKIDDKYPLVSHSITPNQSAVIDIGHTTIEDKKKMNIGAVFLIEDHELHDLRESQLPENGENKEDPHAKYTHLKPTIDLKDPVHKKAGDSKATQSSRSDSLRKYPHSKPAIKVKDPVPKKAVGTKATQTSRSDSLDLDSASLPLSHETSQRSGDLKVDDKCLFVSHSMTPKQSASIGFGHMTFIDKDKTNIGVVFPGGDHKFHDLSESPLPENRESKEDSLGKYPHLKPTVKVKDPVPRKAVEMKATQTSRSESISLVKTQDTLTSYERLIEIRKNPCELHIEKIKKLENMVIGLQKKLSEAKEIKSQLEQQKVERDGELCNLRFALEKEKEKRRDNEMLYKRAREQLRPKEEQYRKEVELKQLEITIGTLDMKLKTVRKNSHQVVEVQNATQGQLSPEENARMQSQDGILTNRPCKQKETEIALKKMNSEASESHEKGKGLLHENLMLRDEIAMLRLEIDMVKNQKQEMEKKYLKENINVQNKDDHLQKTIKLHDEQLNVLRAENTMLKSKLENETQNKERLETEVESYCSRLATALHDHEQGQMSKRDLELAFQRTKYEWFCLRDRMDFDMSTLKDQNEILSQQLFKVGSKFNSLEIELDQTRDALREKSLVLERVQMELSQTQCQKKEIEHKYLHEQGKVIKHTEKLESSEERLSQLQNENVLLQQQVDDAHCKADDQEKAVRNMQEQLQDTIKTLQAKHENQGHMLDERNREIIKEFIHLNKRGYRLGNNKFKRETADSMAKLETVSSKVLPQEEENRYLRHQLSGMEGIQKKYESLENENKKLKQKLVNFRSHVKMNMVEYSEIEQYKRVIDEKARQEVVKKLKEVNQFLQAQAISQEYLEQLRMTNDASVRSQMELRIKDLVSKLSKRKTSQEDSNNIELEKYRQLYQEELKVRMSLENQLHVKNKKLAEISSQLLLKKQQSSPLLCTDSTRPVLEPEKIQKF